MERRRIEALVRKYKGKNFSILGDSVSTLEGYNPPDYSLFYIGDVCEKTGVKSMEDTWWGKVITVLGGNLLVNNSWSGSRVTKLPMQGQLFPSGCSDERTSTLHSGFHKPDVIIVYLGTNDWTCGVIPEEVSMIRDNPMVPESYFRTAYEMMIQKIKRNYPNAEIWCCTLCTTFVSSCLEFHFPHTYAGKHIEIYNRIIRDITIKCNLKLIDTYAYSEPYDSLDGTHPNKIGMQILASLVLREMVKKVGYEYVIFDAGITGALIKLTDEDNGNVYQINRFEVSIGSGQGCDILLEEMDGEISATHVKILFIDQMWFVQDNYSTNGTWLNDMKLQPGKLYQLRKNDVIDIARCKKMIFEQTILAPPILKEQFGKTEPLVKKESVGDNTTTSDELLGTVLDNAYKVMECVGEGSNSKIYCAKYKNLNKLVALKVTKKAGCATNNGMYKMILREAKIMARMEHSSIPRIIDIIENDKYVIVVEDYIQGISLSEVLKTMGPQSPDNVLYWAKQICEVLHYLHSMDPPCIHRDIKPANLMLTQDGKIMLIDFGIARWYDSKAEEDEIILGTRGYAPPEQFGGRGQTDWRTDIYALGVTMAQLLTGIDPCTLPYKIPPIRQVNSQLPQFLEEIINKCTEESPEKRYQSCKALQKVLEKNASSPKRIKKILGKRQ